MNNFHTLKTAFFNYLSNTYALSLTVAQNISFSLNTDATKKDFGDISTNGSLVLAKELKKSPIVLGQEIVQNFKHPSIAKIALAGPGFLRTEQHSTSTQATKIGKAHELLPCPLA